MIGNSSRRWIIRSLLIISVLQISSAQIIQDCSCEVPQSARRSCRAGRNLNRNRCALAGCCFNPSVFSFFGVRCFERDERFCQRQDCSLPAGSRIPCGFSLDQFSCELSGCCFDGSAWPFCYRPNNFISATTPSFPTFPTAAPLPSTSAWGPWSECSDTCSQGIVERRRQCLNAEAEECISFGYDLQEQRTCNLGLCPSWSIWIEGQCSVSCGVGTITRSRSCAERSNTPLECYRVSTQCSMGPCPTQILPTPTNPPFISRPVVGGWGSWGEWSECSFPCAPGTQKRSRNCYNINRILTDPARCLSSFEESSTEETRPCNEEMCEFWTSWGPYSDCSKTCGEGSRVSTRTCLGVPRFTFLSVGFQKCRSHDIPCQNSPCLVSTETITSATTRPFFPASSTVFTIDNFRTSTAPATDPETSTQRIPFTSQTSTSSSNTASTLTNVPIRVASWESWLPWSGCSQTCTKGEKVRIRKCTFVDGQDAEVTKCGTGISIENGECNVNLCLQYEDWKPTTSCSVTCEQQEQGIVGMWTWERKCISETVSEDETCTKQVRKCFGNEFCQTGSPPDPTETSTISSSTQSTSSTAQPTTTPTSTTQTTSTTKPKQTTSQSDGDPWDPWGEWSPCSVTCGDGIQNKARGCKLGSLIELCVGPKLETRKCSYGDCQEKTSPFEPWSQWGECSESCAPGIQSRERACKMKPDSDACSDVSEEIRRCNVNSCEEWGDWNVISCDKPCGGGKIISFRPCRKGDVSNISVSCSKTEEICNVQPCATDSPITSTTVQEKTTQASTEAAETKTSTQAPIILERENKNWKPWGEWSECSSSCSKGLQVRQRECQPNADQQICAQGSRDSRECNADHCEFWGSWRSGPCDRTCGYGTRSRTRKCSTGTDLSHISELCYKTTRACNQFDCEFISTVQDPKFDILFLVDSSSYVDGCDDIQEKNGWKSPINAEKLNTSTAPTYSRVKQFISDFVSGWNGISDEGTRISIQLFSKLCSPKTKSNLHVPKQFRDSHKNIVDDYVSKMPYLCGDYWLYWALQCSLSPVLTEPYGERRNVPNVIIAILSNAPSTSQPSDSLLRIALRRLHGKDSTIIVGAATPFTQLSPTALKRYETNMKKLACTPSGKSNSKCANYIGSIWETNKATVAESIRKALRGAGKI